MRPIPLKYTLDTSFILTNSISNEDVTSIQTDSAIKNTLFDGYFRQGIFRELANDFYF
jgi:hypothetical protein